MDQTVTQETKQNFFDVEGYVFISDKDAELAKSERKKIDYLEEHMNYEKPETILKIYQKTIEERIFKTPIGIGYLKSIQDFLMKQEMFAPEQIPPIPLYQYYEADVRAQIKRVPNRVEPVARKEQKSSVLPFSIFLNIMLVIAILAMFLVSLNAEQPNIWNYERALQDRYATWEQQLRQKEQTLREKELAIRQLEGKSAQEN